MEMTKSLRFKTLSDRRNTSLSEKKNIYEDKINQLVMLKKQLDGLN
jgi:hypothetical protein